MDISLTGGDVAFRTAFSEAYDLTQVLRGVRPGLVDRNEPVDFRLAGLVRRGHRDIWHMDRVLAFSTDECVPFVINGEDIAGNHGYPGGMRIRVAKHGCTCRDVGTYWQDESGLRWTLLRVENENELLFLSDNIGPSETSYAFSDHVMGNLHCLSDGRMLLPTAQTPNQQLTRAIRHIRCDMDYEVAGVWHPLTGYHTGVERARIVEVYEVICPSTVAAALRANRPPQGYDEPPSLGIGKAMAVHRMTYHIEPDGCILCDFDHEVLMDVCLTWYLGIMYQEKCDAFGGGVYRCIPKLRPFQHEGNAYDFSIPHDTTHGPLPETLSLTPDLWANPEAPPDRQIDFLRRADGTCAAAFAGGFLPLYDGAPEIRRTNITDAGDLVGSRKTYPTFAGGKRNLRHIRTLRGVAYKKYFLPETNTASLYAIHLDGATYLYMDFFATAEQVYPLEAGCRVKLLECQGVTWQQTQTALTVQGSRGYAVFCIE